jgi:hypothetical protein
MDAKITMSFDAGVIDKAKEYAANNGMSLSRLTEVLLRKVVAGNYRNIEDMPVADWVSMVSEGEVEYRTRSRSRKAIKDEYYKDKK